MRLTGNIFPKSTSALGKHHHLVRIYLSWIVGFEVSRPGTTLWFVKSALRVPNRSLLSNHITGTCVVRNSTFLSTDQRMARCSLPRGSITIIWKCWSSTLLCFVKMSVTCYLYIYTCITWILHAEDDATLNARRANTLKTNAAATRLWTGQVPSTHANVTFHMIPYNIYTIIYQQQIIKTH